MHNEWNTALAAADTVLEAALGNVVYGMAATVAVGTVRSGETAAVTNRGTAADAVLDFVLPRGAQGEPGPQGEKGEKGEPGADGKTPVAGVDYFTDADRAALVEAVLAALPDGDEVSY